jgi:hypothetical protein
MKVFIWILTAICLMPWTGAAWLAYALIDVSGDWMSGNADLLAGDPQMVEWLSWFGRVTAGFGEAVVIAVWAMGTLVVLAIAWLFTKLVDRDRRIKSLNWAPDDARGGAVSQRIP